MNYVVCKLGQENPNIDDIMSLMKREAYIPQEQATVGAKVAINEENPNYLWTIESVGTEVFSIDDIEAHRKAAFERLMELGRSGL